MDRAISLGARRIELAHEPPFHIGQLRVDPPAHEMTSDGRTIHVQPKTLQVLVALHDKAGAVVTRDELIERCWDGRFVGDDVINRSISLLRRIARDSGQMTIQTVPRSGYRLISGNVNRPKAPEADERPRRRLVWPAVAAILVVAATLGTLFLKAQDHRTPQAVMLTRFDVAGSAPLARTLAAGVSGDLANALSAAGVDVLNPGPSGSAGRATFALGGTTEQPGSELHLTAALQDARDHTILWSTDFSRPVGEMHAMQEQVSSNLAAVLHCALDTSKQPGSAPLDRETIKLYLRACAAEQSVELPTEQIRGLLKQVTARQPNFAEAWARLSFVEANEAFTESVGPARAMQQEARAAAQTALRLNPKIGLAYETLVDLKLGKVPFAELHREFNKALAADPDNPSILNDDGELLMRMGRPDEAVQLFRKGVALDPLSPEQAADLFKGLLDDGRAAEARATLQRALRLWPDDNALRTSRIDYEARMGDAKAALAILDDPNSRPQQMADVTAEAYRRIARVRIGKNPSNGRALTVWLRDEIDADKLDRSTVIPAIAALGEVDAAFDLAFSHRSSSQWNWADPAFLWDPQTEALRRDPRFMALADSFHVADFWSSTGLWPSFCSSPRRPYDCRKMLLQARAREARSSLKPGLTG